MNQQIKNLHERATVTVKEYKKCEAELIQLLQEIGQKRAYLHFNASSLYEYATKILGLSESISYALISVARKSREVPALKEAIQMVSSQYQKLIKLFLL